MYVIFHDLHHLSILSFEEGFGELIHMKTAGYHPLFPVIIELLLFQCGFEVETSCRYFNTYSY